MRSSSSTGTATVRATHALVAVGPAQVSRTYACGNEAGFSATRLVAAETKAMNRPSALSAGLVPGPLAASPSAPVEMISVCGVQPEGAFAPTQRSRTYNSQYPSETTALPGTKF